MSKSRISNLALRLAPTAEAGPLELQLTMEECASIMDAAHLSGLKPGTFARRVIEEVFGEENTLAVTKLHAKEMSLPLATLCKILVLSASGYPEDETLETYKRLAKRAGKKLGGA